MGEMCAGVTLEVAGAGGEGVLAASLAGARDRASQEEVISLQSSAQAVGPSTRFLHPGPGD